MLLVVADILHIVAWTCAWGSYVARLAEGNFQRVVRVCGVQRSRRLWRRPALRGLSACDVAEQLKRAAPVCKSKVDASQTSVCDSSLTHSGYEMAAWITWLHVCGVYVNKVGLIYSMRSGSTARCSHLLGSFSSLHLWLTSRMEPGETDMCALQWLFIGLSPWGSSPSDTSGL